MSNNDVPLNGLTRFHPSLEEDIFEFQRKSYPHRREDWIAPRWRWMFLDSAKRCNVDPMVWLFRKKGEIVGHQGAIAVKVKIETELRTTGWFVETMVLPGKRAGVIGPGVITSARDDLPYNLSLGQTEEMRSIQFQLGWQEIAPLKTLNFLLNPTKVLRGKLSVDAARHLAGPLLGLKQSFAQQKSKMTDITVNHVEQFGPEHDELWHRIEDEYPCAVIRDASYLNWKYIDQPGQSFDCLEVRHKDELIGVVIVKSIDPNESYQYRRAFIVDIVVRPSRYDHFFELMKTAVAASRERRADLIVFYLINEALVKHALNFGFQERPSTRVFLISPDPESDRLNQVSMRPENWLVTQGDSDIDRPWQDSADG